MTRLWLRRLVCAWCRVRLGLGTGRWVYVSSRLDLPVWLSLGLCFQWGRVLGALSGLFVMEAGVRFSPVLLLLNSEVFWDLK